MFIDILQPYSSTAKLTSPFVTEVPLYTPLWFMQVFAKNPQNVLETNSVRFYFCCHNNIICYYFYFIFDLPTCSRVLKFNGSISRGKEVEKQVKMFHSLPRMPLGENI